MRVELEHIDRSSTWHADAMANRAIDDHLAGVARQWEAWSGDAAAMVAALVRPAVTPSRRGRECRPRGVVEAPRNPAGPRAQEAATPVAAASAGPSSVDIPAALAALRSQGWDVAAELARPLATAPHVPRSLVRPLAAPVRDLAHQTVEATQRGDNELAQACWLAFLLFPRLVLHC